ncbi:MAG: ImcF-related family protein, partial [Allosphingosinicella sp.]
LKVYLMLGGKGPLDKAGVESWIRRDWAQTVYPEADSEVERRELGLHLKALLGDRNMARVWAGGAAQLNAPLLAEVRMEVQAMSVGERAYAVMRQRAGAAGDAWAVGDLLSEGDAAAFANPKILRAIEIPYFFQIEGYRKSYLLGLPRVLQDVKRDAWVLGTDAEGTRAEFGEVRSTLAGLYARDYIQAWEKVVQALQPADYFNEPLAYGAFTKSPSPLKRVLMKVRENTRFEGGASAVARRAVTQRITRSRMGTYATDFQAGRETGLDAGGQISSYFAELHEYVGDGRGQAPVDEFVAAVKEAAPALRAARSLGGGGGGEALQASLATAMARVTAAADAAPQMMRGFVDGAKRGGSAAQLSTATGAVSEAYARNVLPACQEAAQERYPFVQTASVDASMPNVQQVFGAGRLIEDFVGQRLGGLLDTSGPLWRWNSESPLTAAFSQATPEAFARARQLRELLISGFAVKVKVEQMGSQTDLVEFSTGASVQRFDRNSLGPKPVSWSPMATPEAYVEMKPAGGEGAGARRVDADGQWALFKLIEKAAREKKGETGMKATFRDGEQWVTFVISWPDRNPFSRDLWSFRCPLAL